MTSKKNPNWDREELIAALSLYFRISEGQVAAQQTEIEKLSKQLRSRAVAKGLQIDSRFRNEAGVSMKLANFQRFDPAKRDQNKKPLSNGGRLEEDVWKEFAQDRELCHMLAGAGLSTTTLPTNYYLVSAGKHTAAIAGGYKICARKTNLKGRKERFWQPAFELKPGDKVLWIEGDSQGQKTASQIRVVTTRDHKAEQNSDFEIVWETSEYRSFSPVTKEEIRQIDLRDQCGTTPFARNGSIKRSMYILGPLSNKSVREVEHLALVNSLEDKPKPSNEVGLQRSSRNSKKSWRQVRTRQGQPEFRRELLDAWRFQCAISGSKVLGVLQAAHIVPDSEDGPASMENGILLRADIHNLFDLDLILLRPIGQSRAKILVDRSLLGTEYEQYQGKELVFPEKASEHYLEIRWSNQRTALT